MYDTNCPPLYLSVLMRECVHFCTIQFPEKSSDDDTYTTFCPFNFLVGNNSRATLHPSVMTQNNDL